MKLPRIYEHFVPGQLATISEMKEKLDREGNTLRKRLSELASRGYIASVRQGLYVVCDAASRYEIPRLSPYVIGSRLSCQSHIGFRSALQYHAGIVPSPDDCISVVSPTKFNSFSYDLNQFIWCQSADQRDVHWACDRRFAPNDVRVSALEKTLIDCIKRPYNCDDFDELIELCLKLKAEPDFTRLLEYVSQTEVSALYNRLGFFLESMAMQWDVPDVVLNALFAKMSKKVSDWNVRFRRETTARAGGSAAAVPTYGELAASRARWKLQFPRHFEGRSGALSASPRKSFERAS